MRIELNSVLVIGSLDSDNLTISLIILNFILFLELVIIIIPYTEGVFHSWFFDIYTFVSIPLLFSLCVENISVS